MATAKVAPVRAVEPRNSAEDGVDLGAQAMRKLLIELATIGKLGKLLLKDGQRAQGTLHALQRRCEHASQLAEACLIAGDGEG